MGLHPIASGLPPGFEFGYDEITAPVTVSATVEASANTVITCAAHTFDGATVLAHFFAPDISVGSAALVIVCLFESTTEIGRIVDTRIGSGTKQSGGVNGFLRFTPTAGAHSYLVKAFRATANGTIGAGGGGTAADVPAFIRFTKV